MFNDPIIHPQDASTSEAKLADRTARDARFERQVEQLAQELAERYHQSEFTVVLGHLLTVNTPMGVATVIPHNRSVPLWTTYAHMAREAISYARRLPKETD